MARVERQEKDWEILAETAHFDAKELARICQLSLRQLQRQFRRCLGRSPQDWLNERRIVAAQHLLLAGRSIKEAGYQVGFKQASHFCREFKFINQMTPSEFIRMKTQMTENVAPR